jgi:zinc protease
MSNAVFSYPGPETIKRKKLSNGMLAVVYENHASPTWVIQGLIPGGNAREKRAQAGIAAVTAQMLHRGNVRYTFEEINEKIESIGANIAFSSGRHSTGFSGVSLVEDKETVLEILALSITRPTFPVEQFELLKGQILTVLQERDSDTGSVADMTFDKLAYPEEHPYSWPKDGYRKTIASLKVEDIEEFYRNCYTPEGGVVVVVGDVDAQEVFDDLERRFGGWKGSAEGCKEPDLSVSPPSEIRQERVTLPDKMQADMVLGTIAITRKSPDYFPAVVANTILGKFGMMGRLGESVREEQGLAYYVYSSVEANSAPSPWIVIAGVNPANVDKAVSSILAEIDRIREEPVSEEELKDSQDYIVGSMPLRLETNSYIARSLVDIAWYDLGWDYLQKYPDRVYGVSVEDVRSVTSRYLSTDAYILAVAGPES